MSDRPKCSAQTVSGEPCRRSPQTGQDRCWHHRGHQCSVCLTYMNGHSQTRTLGCGHEFHTRCLDRWKLSCTGPDPTCPMCREPFDVPSYRCRLIIERVNPPERTTTDFQTSNITGITEGFGIDFRQLVGGRLYTDIHFDVDPNEVLADILRELGLPTENITQE